MYSLGDAAVPWMVLSTLFWGHLEKDKRKRHQKAVCHWCSLLMLGLPANGRWDHVLSRTKEAGAEKAPLGCLVPPAHFTGGKSRP